MNKEEMIIVTGASGGIGRAIALHLASEGGNLVLVYNRNSAAAEELKKECENSGVDVLLAGADLSDEKDVCKMFDMLEKEGVKSISGLVNCAGISSWGLMTAMSTDEWDRIFDVNVKSQFLVTKEVLKKYMIPAHAGSIVNISSMWGEHGASCEVAYSASKGAIISMTKALAKEVGPSGIRVNCVTPGLIATSMNQRFSDSELKDIVDETPLGRIGTPDDVAQAVCFLLSDKASFITGEVLGVNGGL